MEIEIKLLLKPDEAARLRAFLSSPILTIVQTNRYFDDEARSLAKAGWGLRVRVQKGIDMVAGVTLTLKHTGVMVGGFSRRPEFETKLDTDDLEPARILEIARTLLPDPDVLPDVELREVGTMINHRAIHGVGGEPPLVIELDHVLWPDGTETDEVETEVLSGASPATVRRRLEQTFLEAAVPWRVGHESKLERLMRMLDAST